MESFFVDLGYTRGAITDFSVLEVRNQLRLVPGILNISHDVSASAGVFLLI